ncbi:uncharacterized protein LOC118747616 [Rhagoletis pomonella]|uniref:uncharacterized protein LOC118747616 n=1 Tax=Rhagoletis pomonella TaxID=28610 RepID=UPI0017848393|nr:uncharacterized protein LOC118747616 [Rhagoletis pomonella]
MRIKELEAQVEDLTRKFKDLQESVIIPATNASIHAVKFARMIVNTRQSYSEDEKILAQNINYMSTKSYNFMRDDLLFALPHKKTLLRWRPIRSVAPGFEKKVLNNLEQIVKDMSPNERICEILFDEIGIKNDLTYNAKRDIIDGFVDYGGDNNREPIIGNKCLFFMIKGIISKWKYVLSYVVGKDAVKGPTFVKLFHENIDVAQKLGLDVKAVVCDQGPSNVRLASSLNISQETPYFIENVHPQ